MQSKTRLLCVLLGLLAALAAWPPFARAQDPDDPPNRAARLGFMEGSVSFQPAGENDWVEAVPNRPMTTGDKLWADRDSRAEIGLGSSTFYVGSNTGVSFLNLDDNTVQLQLSAGTLDLVVRYLDQGKDFEIDTANQAFSIFRPGRYRLYSDENGDTTIVTVRDGQGQSTGNGQTYTIDAGQQVTFTGTNPLNAEMDQVGPPDDFDNWAYGRDRRYDDSPSAQYCSHDMVGYEDLDQYGNWQPYPQYGPVWYPNVGPAWAPYREGHWAWIDPWGWTWVDSDPWGYAPFHYGRWAFIGGRWGWVPGPRAMAPVYAPALVVFAGGRGPGYGNNVAWFPLGPREVYVPPYHVGPGYMNQVNVSNTTVNQTTVTNVYNTTIVRNNTTVNNITYVNRNVNGAVTAVPQHAFVNAQPVAQSRVQVNARQLASIPVSSRAAVAPTPTAVLGAHANTAGRAVAPPRALMSRPVVARVAPPPPPVPFAARQKMLAQHPGQPLRATQLRQIAEEHPPARPEVHVAPPGRPAEPTPVRRTNVPGNQPGNRPRVPAANERQPENRPGNDPRPENPPARNDRPPLGEGYRPQPQPQTARPEPGRPGVNEHPAPQPQPSHPQQGVHPGGNERPVLPAQPARPVQNRPVMPTNNHPESRPAPNRPPQAQPRNEPGPRQPAPPPQRNQPAPQRDDRPPQKPKPEENPHPGL